MSTDSMRRTYSSETWDQSLECIQDNADSIASPLHALHNFDIVVSYNVDKNMYYKEFSVDYSYICTELHHLRI